MKTTLSEVSDLLLQDFKPEIGQRGVWNFYNPKNLYLTDPQGKAYLQLMGDKHYSSQFHDKTEMGFVLKKVPHLLQQKGVHVGDRIITAISYRHTEDQFKNFLESHFANNHFWRSQNIVAAISSNRKQKI